MNSELKASLIKQEKKISELIRSVKKLQNINDLGSGGEESHQVPSCKEAQAEVISIKKPSKNLIKKNANLI